VSQKRYPTVKQLEAELSGGRIGRFYLFIGEETGEKEKLIVRIAETLFGKDGEAARRGTGRYHAELGELSSAAGFLLSRSMFDERKLCVFFNIERLGDSKERDYLLREMLSEAPDSNHLVMTSSENRPPRFLDQAMLSAVGVYHFWRRFESELVPYIVSSLKREGVRIDDKAASLIVELLGRDVRKIDQAIATIKDYGGGDTVGVELVERLVRDERDTAIREFTDALFRRERRALPMLRRLLEQGYAELYILGSIIRQAELIERFLQLSHTESAGAALERIAVRQKDAEAFLAYAGAFPNEQIKEVFLHLHAADYGIKSMRVSKSITANPLFEAVACMLGLNT